MLAAAYTQNSTLITLTNNIQQKNMSHNTIPLLTKLLCCSGRKMCSLPSVQTTAQAMAAAVRPRASAKAPWLVQAKPAAALPRRAAGAAGQSASAPAALQLQLQSLLSAKMRAEKAAVRCSSPGGRCRRLEGRHCCGARAPPRSRRRPGCRSARRPGSRCARPTTAATTGCPPRHRLARGSRWSRSSLARPRRRPQPTTPAAALVAARPATERTMMTPCLLEMPAEAPRQQFEIESWRRSG